MLPDIPRRIVSNILCGLKAQHRAEEAERFKQNRVHVNVLAVGAIIAQDSTHIGKLNGKKAYAEVFKDAASLEAWAGGNGEPINGKTMLGHLKRLKSQGRLPLVLATDNGSAYKERSVEQWLRDNEVIHLLSRPHTPTDNGRAERGIGEGKALAGLGRRVLLESGLQGIEALQMAFNALNKHLPRNSKGGLTAAQLKVQLPHWHDKAYRSTFYKAACSAIQDVPSVSKREKRKHVREAIFRTLERFGLILRTRGEQKSSYVKQD